MKVIDPVLWITKYLLSCYVTINLHVIPNHALYSSGYYAVLNYKLNQVCSFVEGKKLIILPIAAMQANAGKWEVIQ